MELWNSQHILSNHFHLIIPELRGHGNSKISTDITIRSFVSDILLLLEYLKIDKVHVCGLSLGGIIAQEMYLKKPFIVESLILCNTVSYTPFIFRNMVLFLGIKSMINKSEEENAKLFASHCIYKKKDTELMELAQRTFSINKMTYISSSKSSLAKNYLPFLPFIKIPVLILGSDRDRVTPVFCAYQTHSLLPNSELYIFKECGHLSNIEKKMEFNHKVLSFIHKIMTGRHSRTI